MKRTLMFLTVMLAILTGCGGHELPQPAADLSNVPYVEEVTFSRVTIQDVEYDGATYASLTPDAYPEEYERGPVYAYYVNDDHYVYFCEIEGLDPKQWLVELTDDGYGHFSEGGNIIKALDVTEIPSWLQAIAGTPE